MRASAVTVFAALLLLGCDTAGTTATTDSMHHHDMHQAAQCGDSADIYTQGLERMGSGGHWGIRFVDADPAPPDRGLNTFQVEVVSGDMAAEGVSVRLTPDMPLHGHGTVPAHFNGTDVGDGVFEIEPADLHMPGDWRLIFEVTDGTTTDEVEFNFCLEG